MANQYGRVLFTDTDQDYLTKYIAKYNPHKAGRSGKNLYQTLEEDAQGLWPWSTRHSWQSWRDHYVKNQAWFDNRISRWQNKKGIVVESPQLGRGKKRKIVAEHTSASGKKAKQAHDALVKVTKRAPPRSQQVAEPLFEEEEEGPSPAKSAARRQAKGPDLYAAEIYDSDDVEDEGAEEDELDHSNKSSSEDDHEGERGNNDSAVGRVRPSDHEDVIAKDDRQHHNEERSSQPPIATLSTSPRQPELRLSLVAPGPLTTSTPNQPRASQTATHQSPINNLAEQETQSLMVSKQPTAVSGRHSVEVSMTIQEPTPPISAADPRSPAPAFNPRLGNLDTARGIIPAPWQVQPTGTHMTLSPAGTQAAAATQASANGGKIPTNRTRDAHIDEEDEEDDDGSFFANPTDRPVQSAATASTSNLARRQKPRAPPKVIQGPFGNAFVEIKRGREADQTESEDEGTWPPKRTAATRENRTVKKETLSQGIQGNAAPKASEAQVVKPAASMKSVPFGSRTSSGSSTAELLAAHTAKYARDNNRPQVVVDEAEAARQVQSRVVQALQVEDRARGRRRRHILPDIEPIDFGGHHPFSQAEPSFDSGSGGDGGDGPLLGSPFKTPAESIAAARQRDPSRQGSRGRLAPRSLTQLAGDPGVSSDELIQRAIAAASAPPLAPPPKIPGNRALRAPSPDNVFVVSDRGNLGERRDDHRRQTIGGYEARSLLGVPRVNIFDQGRAKPRRSLPSAMRSRHVSFTQADPGSVSFDLTGLDSPPNLSAIDERIAKNLGVDWALRRMSDNYEYKLDFIKRLWGHVGDFQKTDRLLGVMKTAAEQAASEVLGEEGIDLSDAVEDVLPHSGVRTRKTVQEFQPKPVLEDYDSDYNPPESSRAGQFTRLERQGRREEALRREMRRASQGGFSPHKVRVRPMPQKDDGSPISKARHVRPSLVGETRQGNNEDPREEIRDRGQQLVENRVPQAEARRPAPKPVWGEEEDRMLRSKDEATFRLLEKRMGKAEVRRHLKDLFA